MKKNILSTNQAIDLKSRYQTVLKFLFTVFLMFCSVGVWGQVTTYTYNSLSWGAIPANWVSTSNGLAFVSGRGIQVSTGTTGAFGNSPISFSNISKVVVTYSTNASAGVGTINAFAVTASNSAAQSGTRIGSSMAVITAGGITERTITFTPGTSLTGFVQIYVTCTTNSIYIKSAEITYSSGITSTGTGNWNTGSTWSGGTAPSATEIVTIRPQDIVYNDIAGLQRKAATNVNGAFQIEQGSYVDSGVAGAVDFTYGAAGTLIFNNSTGTYGVNNSDTYWPTLAGPVNVTVKNTGGITLNASRTVNGLFNTSSYIFNINNITIGTDGTLQLNNGYGFSGTVGPKYGNNSLLKYNSGGTPGRSVEWNQTSGTIGTTPGYPNNVQISNNTTFNFPNGNNSTFKANGNLTIDNGSILYQNYSGLDSNLIIGGNLNLAGALGLGGDFTLGGSWTNTGTFSPNNKAVIFNGSGVQSITNATGETFSYFVHSGAGSLIFNNNVTVNGSTGDVLQLLSGTIDLNGKTLTLSGSGGNVKVNGAQTLNSSVPGAIFNVTGNYPNIKYIYGGTLSIPANVSTVLENGLDFGSSVTTVFGTLRIKTNGYVPSNAPIYGNTSILEYNGNTYNIGNEWTGNMTTAGNGTPQNVNLVSSTANLPNSNRGLAGNLNIDTNSTLNLNGTSGDLYIAGNWTNNKTFNANNRAVFFNGSSAQTITGATNFDYLTINNGAGVALATSIFNKFTLDFTNGKLTVGANDLTIGSGGTIINATATKYVLTNGTGQLKRTVGAGNILFPIGPSATNYNPITITNSGTADVYGFRVKPGVADAVDLTYMINDSWYGSEANAGGGAIRVVPEWSGGDIGANFSSTDNFIELYSPAITSYPATISGTAASLTNGGDQFSNNLTGAEYFAVSKSRPQEINIKQGTTNINHNGNFSVGSQISGTSSAPITFTVENTGQANLTVGALTISGANASEFTITQAVSSTVAGGAFTTFTVTFSPTSTGAKTAQLSLVNNDSNENPYKINLTGTGTRSAESQVVIDGTYTAAPDIPYINYLGNDVTYTNSFEVGRFIVNDGASGFNNDADNLPTFLSTLIFTMSGSSNISRVALYDGTTELMEVAGGTPISFSSLAVSVPDNNYKTLSIRVLFKTTVTDNDLIRFSLFTANALASGSDFGTNGSQQMPDQFVEVVADRLAFTTQPTNTGINLQMSDVVVSASDLYNNIDLDLASGSVSLASTGTMTGTPISQSFSSGKATFTGIVHTVTGTGLKLTATTTGLAISNTATSTTFDITTDTSVNGDYRTKADGDWHGTMSSNTSQWQKKISGIWTDVASNTIPSNNTTNTFYIFHNIKMVGNNSTKNIVIENGGILRTDTVAATLKNLKVLDGGTFNKEANSLKFDSDGVLEVMDGGTFTYKHTNTTARSTNLWAGTEKFHPNSKFIVITTDNSAPNYVCEDMSKISLYNGAYFGNITIDMTAGKLPLFPDDFTGILAAGDLIFKNGSDNSKLFNGKYDATIKGNLIIEPTYNQRITLLSGAGPANLTVEGNINHQSNIVLNLNAGTGNATVNLKGNLTGAGTSSIEATTTLSAFNFTGTGTLVNSQTINVANQTTLKNIAFKVNSGTYTKLITNNLDLGSASTLTVNGTFDADQLLLKGTTGSQTLTVNNGGIFKTANTNGFSGSANTSVDIGVENIILASGSTIEYNKLGAQMVTNGVITSPSNVNYQNLVLSGTGIKTATGSLIANSSIVVKSNAIFNVPSPVSPATMIISALGPITVESAGEFVLNNDANLMQSSSTLANDNIQNIGNITVHRTSPMKKNNYTYWSSPVSGRKLQDFSPTTAQVRFYQYDEPSNLFQTVPWATNFILGKGYAIMAPSNYVLGSTTNFDGRFTGVPTNGTQFKNGSNNTVPLDFPLSLSPGLDQGYNMIGNPYPSNIDFDILHTLNSANIYETAYFWTNVDPNRPGSTYGNIGYGGNAYAIYNGTGGVSATSPAGAPNGGPIPTQFIKVGQGFIVKAKTNGQKLIFNNSIRNATGSSTFFSKGAASEKDRFWLKLTTPVLNVNTILIGYIPGATNDFEWDYDAPLFSVASDSFYSILGEEKLGIQGRVYPLNTKDVVALGTKHFEVGMYTISLGDKEGIFAESQSVYLKDKQTGNVTNLSEGNYTFTANAEENQNRFEIIYEPQIVLMTDEVKQDGIQVYKMGNDFVVTSRKDKITSLKLYDISGKLIFSTYTNTLKHVFNISSIIKGVYVIQIGRGSEIITRRVIF